MKKLVVGNWKMHGLVADLVEVQAIAAAAADQPSVDVALCLPATLIERAARAVPGFAIGAQDVHAKGQGAHTGDISVAMLRDAGARLTIVGHSERREDHAEDDVSVRGKAEAALGGGLSVILCVGESLQVREAGEAVPFVTEQLRRCLPPKGNPLERLAIAYEPIWAIGTGKVPSLAEIGEMHSALRALIAEQYGNDGEPVRILYGGSVKASNAHEIFSVADVDGALVGGASLKAADFIPIVEAAAAA